MSIESSQNSPDSLLEALEALSQIDQQDRKERIIVESQEVGYTVRKIEEAGPKNIIDRLVHAVESFFRKPGYVDDLRYAKAIFEAVQAKISQASEEEKQELRGKYKQPTQKAFEGLQRLYSLHEEDNSPRAMIYKDDILEALSVAYQAKDGLNELLDIDIQRIAAPRMKELGARLKAHQIPLFRAEDLGEINRIIKEKYRGKSITIEEVYGDPELKKFLVAEDVAMGRLVESMYEHRKAGKLLNNRVVNWLTTKLLGVSYGRKRAEGVRRTRAIVKFFRKFGIQMDPALEGKMYSYREYHGRGVREEVSKDEAFQRPLSEVSREILLKEAQKKAEEVQAEIGPGKSVVISNSYCRMRQYLMKKGEAAKKFWITGKLLSDEGENVDAAGNEKGYGGKFQFSIKNMFGLKDKSKGDAEHLIPQDKLKIDEAEYLYRQSLTNLVDREDTFMVIQRLAPGDLHRLYESVGGKVLNPIEACRELKDLLQKASPQEAAQLEAVIQRMEREGEDYAKKPYVRVGGSRMSVSTLATKYQSPLSENDRKIVVVKHQDGSVAIHTYIGAVGVNDVDYTAENKYYEIGSDEAKMGFGDGKHLPGKFRRRLMAWGLISSKESIDLPAEPQKTVAAGTQQATMRKNGSTVVSIFFQKNFQPTDEMGEYFQEHPITYQGKKGELQSHEIEIQSPMGQVIGYPTDYHAMQVVKQYWDAMGEHRDDLIKNKLAGGGLPEEIAESLITGMCDHPEDEPVHTGPTSHAIRQQIFAAWNRGDDASPEERTLLKNLRENLTNYVEVHRLALEVNKGTMTIEEAIGQKPESDRVWWQKQVERVANPPLP